jgi:hypothetical protein
LVNPTVRRRASVVVIDDEPTSNRREATCASSPEKSVPTKRTCSPSLAATARNSSLSKPVNWPAELMHTLGGASDSVPTTSVPGVPSPSASLSTALSGSTVGVVYLSSSGPFAALARLVGSGLADCTPGGEHWSADATGAASRPVTTTATASAAAFTVTRRT